MNPFCELIVARDSKGIIGNSAGDIPWHVPEDLAHFRKITTETPNSVLIMGRKTFDSLGAPLKNRIHIILTKNPALHRGNFRDVHFADYSNMPYIFDKFTIRINPCWLGATTCPFSTKTSSIVPVKGAFSIVFSNWAWIWATPLWAEIICV